MHIKYTHTQPKKLNSLTYIFIYLKKCEAYKGSWSLYTFFSNNNRISFIGILFEMHSNKSTYIILKQNVMINEIMIV